MSQLLIAAIKSGIAITGLCATFYTVVDFMFFLSNPNYGKAEVDIAKEASDKAVIDFTHPPKWTWALSVNMSLLSLFTVQHSVLALLEFKDVFNRFGCKDIQRSVYIIFTCLTLMILIKNWHYTAVNIWEFSMDNGIVYWLHVFVHALCWILVYIGTICMDINELLGIKQVYYSLKQMPEPLSYKTTALQKLYSNMRHPSFLGFTIIFWWVPVMRLDRMLLATFLTLYMLIAWETDNSDLDYQKTQIKKKFN